MARFCTSCGTPLADEIARFCAECGAAVAAPPTSHIAVTPKEGTMKTLLGTLGTILCSIIKEEVTMRKKWKYVGAILGTVIGIVCAWNVSDFGAFWINSPVPLAIIGYATGALFDEEHSL